jgi:hypothetical protein
MEHSTAQKLMSIYERLSAVMNDADQVMRTLPEPERIEHLRALGGLMGDVWFKLQLPIVREHRDLDPDGDRFQGKPEDA